MEAELQENLLRELAILNNDYSWLKSGNHNITNNVIKEFCEGNFGKVIQTNFGKSIFDNFTTEVEEFVSHLKTKVECYVDDSTSEADRELEVLLLGVSCLQLFVQNNWLGPCPSVFSPKDILPEELLVKENFKDMMEQALSVDGEPVYHLTTYLEFLLIAKVILSDCKDKIKNLQTSDWWLLRCLSIQQQILDDKANSLRESFIALIDIVQRKEPLMVADCLRETQILFHLEAGYLGHMFFRYREAKEHFQTARKLSGLKVELSGAMGKRTRYQQTEKAQLLLEVTREGIESSDNESTTKDLAPSDKTLVLPKILNLEDDTILDSINFTEDIEMTRLSAIEQSLLVGLMENHRRSRASDDPLIGEEMEAYLSYALNEVQCWSVSTAALYLRSMFERKGSRRVDRSLRQMEELYNQSKREEPSAGQRLQLFYSVSIVPLWKVQSRLADILLSVGAVGSALEIFERLQLWEDAIACYQRLGKLEKAVTVIREQLEKKETPNLWCFLGDITQDPSHYEKAWEMSNHRSARAQRCLGYLYFSKQNYEKCIECFQKSLSVNGLQIPVWFTYGCAAMAAEDFNLAVTAFRRCVMLDYDNFEAWGNLATAYVRLKEKKKAFSTIKDAIKCNYESWRLWDNMLVIATDCGEFNDVIRAYHRLMDLRDKWEDTEVLNVIVRAVLDDLPDGNNRHSSYLLPNLKELFGRITAKVTNNAEIWRLYAKLSQDDTAKSLQYLKKCHRCLMQTKDWEKDIEECENVAEQSIRLADVYLQTTSQIDNQAQKLQTVSSAKLMLKGVLSKIKQEHTDPISQEVTSSKVKDTCAKLDEKIETVVEEQQKLKS